LVALIRRFEDGFEHDANKAVRNESSSNFKRAQIKEKPKAQSAPDFDGSSLRTDPVLFFLSSQETARSVE
jgi:hypothetical protein